MRFSVALGVLLSAKPLSASLGREGKRFRTDDLLKYADTNPIALGFCRYDTVSHPMMRLRQIGQSVPDSDIG